MRPAAWLLAALLLLASTPLAMGGALPVGQCSYHGSRVPTGHVATCLRAYTYYYAATSCGHLGGETNTPLSVDAAQQSGPLDVAASGGVVQRQYDYAYLECWGGPASGSGKSTHAGASGTAQGVAASAGFDQRRDAETRGAASSSSSSTSVHAAVPLAAASVGQSAAARDDGAGSSSSKETGVDAAAGPAPAVFAGQRVRDGDCALVVGDAVAVPCGPVPVAPDAPEVPTLPPPFV